MDFKDAKILLNAQELEGFQATERDNKIHIIGILEVYAWHCIIDAFGDMPYSEALLGAENTTPAYDNDTDVYADIIDRLKADIAALNVTEGSFGGADFIYNGDVAAWKKFGASLLLRLGVRIADADAAAAQSAVGTAVAAGVFASQDESGYLFYNGVVPHVNCIYGGYTIDGRKDYIPTNTVIDKMNNIKDPRLFNYFTTIGFMYQKDDDGNPKDTTITEGAGRFLVYPSIIDGSDSIVYKITPFDLTPSDTITADSLDKDVKYHRGAIAGLDGAQSYNNYSHFAPRFFEATFEAILIDYVEVEFLLAEAAERGLGVSGTADEHYANAITESFVYWGGDEAAADDYIATVPYSSADWKEILGTQKWIALYNRGVEAWTEWRRLDFPILNVPEGMVYGDIPLRMPYPYDEVAQNGDNYAAASAAIGGDEMSTPVFWDKY